MKDHHVPTHQADFYPRLDRLIENGSVPTLPAVAQRLVEACRNDQVTTGTLTQIIETDGGLASRLLQVANSAFYGRIHKTSSLKEAITSLGMKYVKSVALGFHLSSALSGFEIRTQFDFRRFWQQSVVRGILCRLIAKSYCPGRQEEAFLVGLLQDCGVPLLAEAIGPEYGWLWLDSQSTPLNQHKLEQNMFGVNHVLVSEQLIRHWALPELLAEPIISHHLPSTAHASMDEQVALLQISYFAGSLSLSPFRSLSEEDLQLPDYAYKTFKMDREAMGKLFKELEYEYELVVTLFGPLLTDCPSVLDVLLHAKRLLSELASERAEAFDLEEETRRVQQDYQEKQSLNSHHDSNEQNLNSHYSSNDLFEMIRQSGPAPEDSAAIQAKPATRQPLFRGLIPTKEPLTPPTTPEHKQVNPAMISQTLATICRSVRNGKGTLALVQMSINQYAEIVEQHDDPGKNYLTELLSGLLMDQFGSSLIGWCRLEPGQFLVAVGDESLEWTLSRAKAVDRSVRTIMIPEGVSSPLSKQSFSASLGVLYCESGATELESDSLLNEVARQSQLARDNAGGIRCCIKESARASC